MNVKYVENHLLGMHTLFLTVVKNHMNVKCLSVCDIFCIPTYSENTLYELGLLNLDMTNYTQLGKMI